MIADHQPSLTSYPERLAFLLLVSSPTSWLWPDTLGTRAIMGHELSPPPPPEARLYSRTRSARVLVQIRNRRLTIRNRLPLIPFLFIFFRTLLRSSNTYLFSLQKLDFKSFGISRPRDRVSGSYNHPEGVAGAFH